MTSTSGTKRPPVPPPFARLRLRLKPFIEWRISQALKVLLKKTFNWLSSVFGFQKGNTKNQREHLVLLLANIYTRKKDLGCYDQAICEKYDLKIDSFSSLVNGKAIWCLLDYYFPRELSCSCSNKDSHETRGEESIMSATDYTDAVHNFVLSQKLTALLGNFPEVLQISELLEHNGAVSDQSVVVLLVFLLSQLIVKKNVVMPDPRVFFQSFDFAIVKQSLQELFYLLPGSVEFP
ncbi:hypothetical protein CRYUN_Cryun01aG0116500 [Craigia yunnanensis]